MQSLPWIILGIAAFLILFPLWYDRTEAGQFAAWVEDAAQRGITTQQKIEEDRLVLAYARLRRDASQLCVELKGDMNPELFQKLIAEEAKHVANVHGKQVAKQFVSWAKTFSDGEILHPAAYDLYVKRCTADIWARPLPHLSSDEQNLIDSTRRLQ